MPKQETVDKFFGAVDDAYDALIDSIKAANDRGYRVSKRLIDEVEKGQREAVGLTHRFASARTRQRYGRIAIRLHRDRKLCRGQHGDAIGISCFDEEVC